MSDQRLVITIIPSQVGGIHQSPRQFTIHS
ncbi:hypothetical protein L8106_11367 [Lyngbya sp. PCC 8106]|nr:hypothetical protein L8106_11367 [Lyngbya sp. PCC 8106]